MRTELAKVRYLPLPRYTALAVLSAAIVVGALLLVFKPKNPANYVSIPSTTTHIATVIAAMVFGVWLVTVEFGSGTLQRTLTAQPDRLRLLLSKLAVVILGAAVVSAACAAAAGGLTNFATTAAGAPVGAGEIARSVFATVPDAVLASVIGFAFGLIARSTGGGIAGALVFYFVFSSILGFIPGVADYAYSQASTDLVSALGDTGDTVHSAGVALLICLAWLVVITVPPALVFARADLK